VTVAVVELKAKFNHNFTYLLERSVKIMRQL